LRHRFQTGAISRQVSANRSFEGSFEPGGVALVVHPLIELDAELRQGGDMAGIARQVCLLCGIVGQVIEFLGVPVALAYNRFDETVKAAAAEEYLKSIEHFRNGNAYSVPGEFVVARACKPCK
jgi:hypothetical protein